MNNEEKLSVHVVNALEQPCLMQMKAQLGNIEVSLLVDGGASHNFINSKVVASLGLVEEDIGSRKVEIANGNQTRYDALVRGVNMKVQGIKIVADLNVLDMLVPEVILGNGWLRSIERVLVDYESMTMEFHVNGKKKKWAAVTPKEALKTIKWGAKDVELWSKREEVPMI